jgi:hypothetical protein
MTEKDFALPQAWTDPGLRRDDDVEAFVPGVSLRGMTDFFCASIF